MFISLMHVLMVLVNFQDLDDMNIEIMRNTLYKAYLEDFYRFCQVNPLCDFQVSFLSAIYLYSLVISSWQSSISMLFTNRNLVVLLLR